jgi:O-antigen/teichoic acid export membrane protein
MEVSNAILSVQVFLTAIGTVIALESGFGIKGLIINGLIVSVLSLAGNYFFARRIVPFHLTFIFHKSRFREMFRYSFNLQLSNLIYFWIEPLNKILISHFLSVAYVGYYDIALKFNSRITTLVRSALSSIFPAAAEKHEQEGGSGIEALRKKALRYLYPLVTALYLTGLLITPSFVALWLGKDFQATVYAILLFLGGSYFSILATPGYILLMGAGFSKDTLKVQIQSSLVNVAAIALFAGLFGFYGFCAGYTSGMIFSFFATHRIYRQRFGKDNGVYHAFRNRELWISCMFVTVVFAVFYSLFRAESWISLSALVLLLGMTTLVSFWKLKVFTIEDYYLLFGKRSGKD